MPGKKTIIIVLVLLWAAVFVGSFVATSAIEGPRNIDTGFKRLDTLALYQLIAIVLACVSAVLGIAWRKQAARVLLIGLVPISVTALLIAGVFVVAMFLGNRPAPQPARMPTAPAAATVDRPST